MQLMLAQPFVRFFAIALESREEIWYSTAVPTLTHGFLMNFLDLVFNMSREVLALKCLVRTVTKF